jgi:diguanylate cyclase (GGDEF)-like protein
MVTKLLARYRERVRRRPDSEHSQAFLRLGIVGVGLIYAAWITGHDPDGGTGLWVTNLTSAVFSVLLFGHILWNPKVSPWRRIVGALHDNVAVTIWLYLAGPMGALYVFVYPFVTVGNGFRFGPRYLAVSGFLGAIGIGSLVAFGPGWQADRTIGLGVFVSHVFVTVYIGLLLRRMQKLQQQLQMMATHDPLTGLPNRRLFLDTLSYVLVGRRRESLACLYVDLNGFKLVNDRAGHATGDQLLRIVGDTIRECVRAADLTARLGGDEFGVILVGLSGPDDAKLTALRIIAAITRITEANGHPVDISASVGIAFLPAEAHTTPAAAEALINSADQAMYGAKKSARGQVRLVDWSDGSPAAAAMRAQMDGVGRVPLERASSG